MQPQLDLTQSPGLEPCDRCERIVNCEWFGCFSLCDDCRPRAVEAIGLEAGGRAIHRLAQLHQAEARIEELVERIGSAGVCGCGKEIYWLRHRNGVNAPYDRNGVNHFATCPKRGEYRRRAKAHG
jgi:hypothetical protein